ncbi:MAG: 5'/3'-nucleotidase SurE [Flavobacteriales bacterium]|nr:5'/3'-nucleotidase SurE [Flavobacteriales bacterium]
MRILIVNDDGITAPGINALIEVAKKFGQITVVAPDKPQSGMGHAVTLNSTLRVNKTIKEGIEYYACSGTPVDCVKIAVSKLMPERPNLILSGINHGSNSSINVIYSGTMSAAMEGSIEGIPSIGFSLCNHDIDADFSTAKIYVEKIIESTIQNHLETPICLNVNIPNATKDIISGIKICRQANGNWEEDFDERTDPHGKTYYWLTGKFVIYDKSEDTDEWALANNYVSVVPVQYDVTNYSVLNTLKQLENA